MNSVISPASSEPDTEKMTTDALLVALDEATRVTVRHVARMAAIVGELRRRNVDLASRGIAFLDQLVQVAQGDLSPALLVRFQSRRDLLARMAGLPIAEQERLAGGGLVPYYFQADGQTDCLQCDPRAMSQAQIAQVFAGDHVRTQNEQLTVLVARQTVKVSRDQEWVEGLLVDYERGGVVVGKEFVSLNTLAKVTRALRAVRRSTV